MIEEERVEYLFDVYKYTDRVWDGARTVTMRYTHRWSELRLMSVENEPEAVEVRRPARELTEA